ASGLATVRQLFPQRRDFVFPRPTYPDIEKDLRKRFGNRLGRLDETRALLMMLSPNGAQALIAVQPRWRVKDKGNSSTFFHRSTLELWDIATCKRQALWSRRFHGEQWRCLRFSPDGKRAVTGSDRGLKVWDVSTGKVERTMDDRTTWTSHP